MKMNKYQTLNSDGFELNYYVKGTGKPILVIGSSVYYPQLFSEDLYDTFRICEAAPNSTTGRL